MNTRKTIRFLAVTFAVLALLIFATTVVSDWDCRSSADDLRCPYCHLSHQAPAPQLEVSRIITALEPVGSLPLPQDTLPLSGPLFSETAPRAPPTA
jgi:hypothetical protein